MALGLILLLILFLPPNAMCAVESALVEITENATTTESETEEAVESLIDSIDITDAFINSAVPPTGTGVSTADQSVTVTSDTDTSNTVDTILGDTTDIPVESVTTSDTAPDSSPIDASVSSSEGDPTATVDIVDPVTDSSTTVSINPADENTSTTPPADTSSGDNTDISLPIDSSVKENIAIDIPATDTESTISVDSPVTDSSTTVSIKPVDEIPSSTIPPANTEITDSGSTETPIGSSSNRPQTSASGNGRLSPPFSVRFRRFAE